MTSRIGRNFHKVLMAVWGIQMIVLPFVMPLDWRLYLLEVSLYANFVGHWSGWSAERPTEVEGG